MATTDLYTIAGSLYPTRHCMRFLTGGATDDGIQIDTMVAAMVAGNHTKGTITAWVMIPDDINNYCVFGAGDANVAEYIYIRINAGTLQFAVVDSGVVVNVISASKVIQPHTWTHIAVVQDGSRPTWYVNGEKVATTDTVLSGEWFSNTDGIDGAHIGAADSVGGDAALTLEFGGYISDFKVWSGTASTCALTAQQVKDDYNGVSNTTSLIAWYTMDGTVVNKANPGTYDGTIVGSLIYCDANEFTSRLTFGCGTPVTADNISISISNGMGIALVVQQA